MGLFGSFNPVKAVTRAIGLPDTAAPIVGAVFPALIATQIAVQAVGGVAGQASPPASQRASSSESHFNIPVNVQQPTNYPQQVPVYGGNYIVPQGGSYLGDYYGGGQWDSSISPMTYSPRTFYQPASTYYPEAPRQTGIWEDLVQAAPLIFGLL